MRLDEQRLEALAKEIDDIKLAKKLARAVAQKIKQARKLEKQAEKLGCLILLTLYYKDNEQKLRQYFPELKKLLEKLEFCGSHIRSNTLLSEIYQVYLGLKKQIKEVEARIERASSNQKSGSTSSAPNTASSVSP